MARPAKITPPPVNLAWLPTYTRNVEREIDVVRLDIPTRAKLRFVCG